MSADLVYEDGVRLLPWARVGVDDLGDLGAACRLAVTDVWQRHGRRFGMLETGQR